MDKLIDYRQLPILPGTKERVLSAMHRPNATAESIASACRRDPVLQLHIWLSVNQTLNRSGNELHHLAHGISLLGLPYTEQLVGSAPQMITPNDGYLECLTQSDMSQRFARTIKIYDSSEQERWEFATLLTRYHEWALWHHCSDHMRVHQGLAQNPSHAGDMPTIEQQLFGRELHALGTQLSQQLPLPSLLKQAWQLPLETLNEAADACLEDQFRQWVQQNPTKEREFFSHSASLWLINSLCHEAAMDAHSQRCADTLTILSRQLLKPVDKLMCAGRQALVSVEIPRSSWPHPAHRLLQHWRAERCIEALSLESTSSAAPTAHKQAVHKSSKNSEPDVDKTLAAFRELAQMNNQGEVAEISLNENTGASPTATKGVQPSADKSAPTFAEMPDFLELPSSVQHRRRSTKAQTHLDARHNPDSPQYTPPPPEPVPPPPFRNDTLLDEHLTRLHQRGQQFQNLNQLLLFALSTLVEGLGLQQVVILVIHNKQFLRCHCSHGFDADDPIKKINIPLDASTRQGVIGQLFKQPAGINITASNLELVRNQCPSELSERLEENTTALMSLFRQTSPVGLIYVADSHLNVDQYQQFKRVCNATSAAIKQFSQHKYTQAKGAASTTRKAAQ
tara:strand:- start:11251 stop:13116 length:1866 start_codon:yes stop_codon:yes gene_type:complete